MEEANTIGVGVAAVKVIQSIDDPPLVHLFLLSCVFIFIRKCLEGLFRSLNKFLLVFNSDPVFGNSLEVLLSNT